jgi:hypothetical protein
VRRECRLVAIDLVEPKAVRVVLILDDIEAQAARLVGDRVLGVIASDVQES